jgi:hypothetical protein
MMTARPIAMVGLALALAGCAFADQALIPSLSGEPFASAPAGGEPAAEATDPSGRLGEVRTAVADQSTRFQTLRQRSGDHAAAYQATVGHIAGQLQGGPAAGDPALMDEWRIAEEQLGRLEEDLGDLRSLADEIAGSAAAARGLQDAVRARYATASAADRDSLRLLDENTTRVAVEADRLLADATLDAARQGSALAMESNNLTALSVAVRSGRPVTLASAAGGYAAGASAAPPGAGVASRRPFIVIRFDRPDVDFTKPMQDAVAQALARRPNVAFDVVAVGVTDDAASAEEAALRLQDVVHVLEGMGVTRDRIAVSSATSRKATSSEVQLYLR